MSQRGVEGLLGRMVTDESFRRRFHKDPVTTCGAEAMEVTARELEAVLTLDEKQIAAFARQLDSRIVRAAIICETAPADLVVAEEGTTGTGAKQQRLR